MGGRRRRAGLCVAVASCVALSWSCVGAAAADPGTVSGRVTDMAGNPLAGMTVGVDNCMSAPPGPCGAGVTTRHDGTYSLSYPAGDYTLTVHYYDHSALHTEPVAIPSGGQVRRDLQVSTPPGATATLKVRVRDEDGLPQRRRGASVTGPEGPDSLSVTNLVSDPEGGFTLRALPPGAYRVAASPFSSTQGVDSAVRDVTLEADRETAIDLILPSLVHPLASSVGVGSQRALALLNAERARHGLPADVVENPRWSASCAQHNRYQLLNDLLEHEEAYGRPGYSEAGNWAGTRSVLSRGDTWTAAANPWVDAPIHLIQLYTPSLATVGISDSDRFVCATTWPGMDRFPFAEERISTVPGDGVTGIPPAQTARERPFVPGDHLGLPQGTTTGPHLFVYRDEPDTFGPADVQIDAASLTGPRGPVEVRWMDDRHEQAGGFITGGIVVPVAPLAPNARYVASVTVATATGPRSHVWSFSTGAAAPRSPGARTRARAGRPIVERLRLTGVAAGRPRLSFRVRARAGGSALAAIGVRLPRGLSWGSARRVAAGVRARTVARRRLGGQVAGRGRTRTLTLRKPARRLELLAVRRSISVGRRLRRQARQGGKRVVVVVSVTARDGRMTRTRLRGRVSR